MPVLKYTTDVSQAVAEVNKLNDAAGRKTQEALKKTADESTRLSTLQKKLLRESTTAHEDYQRKLDALKGLYDQKLIPTTEKYRKEVERVTKEYFAQKNASNEIDKSSEKSFGPNALTRLASYAAGFVSVSRAIALVTSEMRAQQQLIDKAEEAKMGISQARNVLRRNLLSLPPEQRERIVGQFGAIAREMNVGEVPVQLAGASAVSASSGDVAASLAAVRLAAKVFPDQPMQIGQIAASLLDLSKVTGSSDPRTNFGLLLQVGALSRVVDPSMQAKNIAPALIGTEAFGASPQVGGALFAALSTAGGDPTGERTGTAAIKLAKQLEEYDFGSTDYAKKLKELNDRRKSLIENIDEIESAETEETKRDRERLADLETARKRAEADMRVAKTPASKLSITRRLEDIRKNIARIKSDEDISKLPNAYDKLGILDAQIKSASELSDTAERHRAFFQTADLGQRISYLQKHPELAEKFIETAGFEVKALGPIRRLLTSPHSYAAKMYAQNLGAFSQAVLLGMADKAMSGIDVDKVGQSAVRRRALESTVEGMRLEAPGALTQTERDLVKEILQRVGSTALGATASDFMAALGGGEVTLDDAIQQLKRRRVETRKIPSLLAPGGYVEFPIVGAEKDKQALAEAIAKLEAVQNKQLEEQKKTTRALEGLGGLVGVAE